MIKQDIIHALRKLKKDKVFSIITITGLAIGIAASMFIAGYVLYEFSYDKFWENADRIYRIDFERYQDGALETKSARSLGALGVAMIEEMPEIENVGFIFKDDVSLYTNDNQIQDINFFWTDTSALKLLEKHVVYGSLDNPFPDIFGALLSESTARKLYGNTDPVGKQFKVNQGWEYHVTGVFEDIPKNSHVKIDALLNPRSMAFYARNFNNATGQVDNNVSIDSLPQFSLTNRGGWRRNRLYNYIQLREGVHPKTVEEKIPAVIEKYAGFLKEQGISIKCTLRPITEIHLNSHLETELQPNNNKKSVVGLAVIAILILCIAWINFVNLTMVKAVERSKAIGIRKVVGAHRKNLVKQFLVETAVYNMLSVIGAILIILVFRGQFIKITGISGFGQIGGQFYILSGLIIITGSFLSGLYPALMLSSFNPISLFQGLKKGKQAKVDLRKTMVIIQFAASIIMIIGTVVVYRQINYMRTQELGVNIDQKIITNTPMSMIVKPDLLSTLNTYKTEVEKLSGVEVFTTSSSVPGKEIEYEFVNIKRADIKGEGKPYSRINVDPEFFNTYGLKLISGEYFAESDIRSNNVLLNESALKELGYQNPNNAVGQFIKSGNRDLKIKGVVQDHHHESLKKSIEPIIYHCNYRWFRGVGYYTIKVNTSNIRQTISDVKKIWDRIYPIDNFEFFFLDESFNEQYKQEEKFAKLSLIFSFLAILIACLGLLGLAAFTAEQRTKEIGVRKVNGAKVKDILLMLNMDFIKSVVISFLVACPVAYLVMNNWLQNFAYKTTISWWIFALSGTTAAFIAISTVSWQTMRTVRRNPVEALRYE